MRKLRYLLKIYRIFTVQDFKNMLEYKVDFIVGVISVFFTQALNIIFIWIIFSQIPSLEGYDLNEVIFIYAFSLLPKGIDHMLFDNLWVVANVTVEKGEFDKYLTRPINPLFHVLVEKFQIDAFGEIIVSVILLVSTISNVNISWNIFNIGLFILVIPFATLIYTSVKIATTAISFWTKRSGNITSVLYTVSDFAKYPVNIYNSFVRTIITFIIPFAFTAFYPASYFLTGENPFFYIGGTVIVSIVMLLISNIIWGRGILVYESAGS